MGFEVCVEELIGVIISFEELVFRFKFVVNVSNILYEIDFN